MTDHRLTTLLHEFNAIRAEILARSNAQHTLLNMNVTILGTIVGFAIAGSSRQSGLLLLLVPLVSNSIGFLYLDHHTAIQRAGVYVDNWIRPALQEVDESKRVLSWEDYFNAGFWRRKTPKVVFWSPLSILFLAAPIGATAYTLQFLKSNTALILVWVLGILTEITLIVTSTMMFRQKWARGYRDEPIAGEKTDAPGSSAEIAQ